ncbi:hypothetical protein EZI54_10460 [Marinobacter halodurans]|uniref:Uncharacterized protein n=1 Tax=Marinobacter halodurans TaxID=2528979 RepID=A0ABY1ZPC7_9GAMM|nr:hypothetical protein [Marinobacter halodurans]TBW56054.1 hypothetical protein EZI54_10460 [Marinobacter halodurans]
MSIAVNRVIGLTEERQMEARYGVADLHIHWREDVASQRQTDPNGQAHLAPLVSWTHKGRTYRYVPRLTFRIEFRSLPAILRQCGLQERQYFVVDALALSREIGGQLASCGRLPDAVS